MGNPLLQKTFEAGGTLNPCRILKMGSADYKVIQATDDSSSLVGVVDPEGIDTGGTYASGDRADVIMEGIADVQYGDTVTRGEWLTADANGKAVPAVITPGDTVHVIGQALVSGVTGDVAPVFVRPTVIANDTGIATADVTITTGQLLALNAVPKELVAAPGNGKIIVPVDIQLFLDYNSAAYNGIAGGEDLAFRYTDGSGVIVAACETTGFLDLTADAYRLVLPINSTALTGGFALTANAALVAHLLSGEIATGDSPLKVRTRYRTIDAAW